MAARRCRTVGSLARGSGSSPRPNDTSRPDCRQARPFIASGHGKSSDRARVHPRPRRDRRGQVSSNASRAFRRTRSARPALNGKSVGDRQIARCQRDPGSSAADDGLVAQDAPADRFPPAYGIMSIAGHVIACNALVLLQCPDRSELPCAGRNRRPPACRRRGGIPIVGGSSAIAGAATHRFAAMRSSWRLLNE